MSEPVWPSAEAQLARDQISPGTALERLIRENQDFHLLNSEEASDRVGLPPWLRVYWRKQHPELEHRVGDPTGGYPRVLRRLYDWMLAHPDLPDGSAPDPPPAAPVAEAALAKVGADLRVSGAQSTPRSESDIRLDARQPNRIIAAANSIGGTTQAQFFSSNGGTAWQQTTLPLVSGDGLHSDPTVTWTSDGTAWATTIGIQGSTLRLRAYRSSNGGASWSFDATASGSQTATDKELMWVDRGSQSPFADNIYLIWHNGPQAFVNRRTGPAGAWQTPVQVSGAETTGTAIGGDVTTNRTGEVFAFWPDTGSRKLLVAKSTDGGASFAAPVVIATTFASFDIGVPAFASRRALIYISGSAYSGISSSFVYAVWTNLTGAAGCTSSANEPGSNVNSNCKTRIWFARSTNGGTTWQTPMMINDQPSRNDQFNPRMAVDEADGTLVVIYYDTVSDPGRRNTSVWYQSSTDNGTTWSTPIRVSSAQTDETSAGADLGNQYGDYNGLTGHAGAFFPSWTDRRGGAREEIWTAPINPDSVAGFVTAALIQQT